MRILAVDPGIVNCGVAVVCFDAQLPVVQLLHTEKQKSAVSAADRKAQVGRFVRDLFTQYTIDLLAVEDQMGAFFGHQARGTTNANSVHLQGVVDVLRGVALCHHTPFLTLSPLQVRFRLGLKSGAEKSTVAKAVRLRTNRSRTKDATEHELDALAVALAAEAEHRLQTAIATGSRV